MRLSKHRRPVRKSTVFLRLAVTGSTLCFMASLAGCVSGTGSSGSPATPQSVSVSIQPGSSSLAPGAQQQFSAIVMGTTNTTVSWAATGGTVSSTGVYTAGSNSGVFSVTVTSAADPVKWTQATVTVKPPPPPPVTISVQPSATSLTVGAQKQFSASVGGTTNTNVTWTATGGSISSAGNYTAGSNPGTFSVTATSAADTSKSAQAAVTVTAAPPSPPQPGTASSISKDGITWTFSEPVPVG